MLFYHSLFIASHVHGHLTQLLWVLLSRVWIISPLLVILCIAVISTSSMFTRSPSVATLDWLNLNMIGLICFWFIYFLVMSLPRTFACHTLLYISLCSSLYLCCHQIKEKCQLWKEEVRETRIRNLTLFCPSFPLWENIAMYCSGMTFPLRDIINGSL